VSQNIHSIYFFFEVHLVNIDKQVLDLFDRFFMSLQVTEAVQCCKLYITGLLDDFLAFLISMLTF
jgi:hypothetical protein